MSKLVINSLILFSAAAMMQGCATAAATVPLGVAASAGKMGGKAIYKVADVTVGTVGGAFGGAYKGAKGKIVGNKKEEFEEEYWRMQAEQEREAMERQRMMMLQETEAQAGAGAREQAEKEAMEQAERARIEASKGGKERFASDVDDWDDGGR